MRMDNSITYHFADERDGRGFYIVYAVKDEKIFSRGIGHGEGITQEKAILDLETKLRHAGYIVNWSGA